jgi:predicted DNA-binding transcriptional regulator AlpA
MAVKRSDQAKHAGNEWVNRRIRQLTRELHELTQKDGDVSVSADERGPAPAQIVGGGIGKLKNRVDRLLRLKEVLEIIPVSKSTWWAGIKSGRYPAPVRNLGPRITAWTMSSIMQLVNGGEGENNA